MRYKTFRSLTPVLILTAVLCLAGMPVSAAPRSEAAPAAAEAGWLSAAWQWLGQLWNGGGGVGLGWLSQASTAPATGNLGTGTGGTDSLKYSDGGVDRGAALDPNGLR